MKKVYLIFLMAITFVLPAMAQDKNTSEVRFTSTPDIFNWNIGNPQKGWDETIDWFFKLLKEEGADFNLNAGDIMDARWWDNAAQVEKKCKEYWLGLLKRYEAHGITAYIAPGDHEYGDDGGLKKGDIARAFGEQFTKLMGMPTNGPDNHKGRAFYVRKNNLLIITLDTFEDAGKRFAYTVGDKQLAWMEKVLVDNKDAEFVIVQGHLPIIGPVKSKNSSASMLKGGEKSKVWQLMVKHKVDVYLCGEHHRITAKKKDGIWQLVHGALWGTQTDLNYLRGVSKPGELKLELLEFNVEYSGGYIGDHPHRGPKNKPRENISLTAKSKKEGPRLTGVLVLNAKDGKKSDAKVTGWFEKALQKK